MNGYFNKHDPSPIYKRQLDHHFEEYILESVKSTKRYHPVFYKLSYKSEDDKKYAEPLMYAIRRHFADKKLDKELEFIKFKRRNSMLLIISIVIVILFQGLLPTILNVEHGVHTGLINSLDIFAWVLLWHPIDELMFQWNKYLKQICLLNKLATSESIIVENEKSLMVDRSIRVVA
jgi:hypothetical protein